MLQPQFPIPDAEPIVIRGVVFDMDGVLTDTLEFHYQTWQRLADEENIPFDRKANEALRGLSRRDSLMAILGDRMLGEAIVEEMLDRKNRYFLEFIQTMTQDHLLPGVLDLLQELRSDGIRIAIASASQNVDLVTRQLGLTDWVDAITNVYNVPHPKPAPDVFLYAAEQIGLPPHQCIAIEDAESGVKAALDARMWVVGLGPQERVGAAHVILSNLNSVRWKDLLDKIQCCR
ncbi:beta-phosphoglucomutase [Oscillatoriales cyanobacterium LEGE 11467]|uniref:Beta-phosphoglucomutase n=1 Tax=Zarconia navalis LEGE 11467 TaxID=1828826 RepID=A0A928VY80_9CYAN|nr:beta-phosphoglucomutase [Zarconia navalis]MBE9042484.1 beta-phosphoglucomutase [Zarconia navalis LEGE 11467]